jgi:hypothetical protein
MPNRPYEAPVVSGYREYPPPREVGPITKTSPPGPAKLNPEAALMVYLCRVPLIS